MAKATKSGSGRTSKSQTSKASADKADPKTPTETEKASEASSASKAASSKSKTATEKSAAASASKDTSVSAATSKTAETKDTSVSKPDEVKADTTASKDAKNTASDAKPSSGDLATKSNVSSDKTETTNSETKQSETKSAAVATPRAEPAAQRRSVFWPLVLGGVIAGVIGFAVSEMNVLNTRVDLEAVEAQLSTQQERISALEGIEPPAAPDLSGIEASIAALSDTVSELEAELKELAARPVPTGDGSAPAVDYSADFEAMQSSIAAQQKEIEAQRVEISRLLDNAQSVEEATAEAARKAAIQSALTKITAAVNAGGGYQDALAELKEAGVDEVSEALSAPAEGGVPTLLKLQTDFPESARASLGAARSAGAATGEQGFGGFLKRQLGARSTAPREGNDPDAILSRAEAAVRDGRVDAALAELDSLPEEAQAAMEDWLAGARARAEAEAAIDDLSQRLTAN